jgi:hypothetical protein
MHLWNIQVQFTFSDVRNTSTHVGVNALMHAQGGTVSPTNILECGKFGVIIKDNVC